MSKNDTVKKWISSKSYRNNYDRIFSDDKPKPDPKPITSRGAGSHGVKKNDEETNCNYCPDNRCCKLR